MIGEVESRECVIFLNSVTNIAKIIKTAKIPSEDVNIIVAKNDENDKLIKEKVGKDYAIGSLPLKDEPHKMFTFCTSTAFAGCDFYSTCASTFVISDNKRVHTSIDIATELVQIAGRQRLVSNPFRKQIFFIYNVDNGEMDAANYRKIIDKRLDDSKAMAEFLNGSCGSVRDSMVKQIEEIQRLHKYSENYVRYDSDLFTVNRWAYLSDLFAYDVQHENYENSVIVKGQLDNSGFDTSVDEKEAHYIEDVKWLIIKDSFADRMKRYCEYRLAKEDSPYYIDNCVMDRQYPDLKIYYNKLGVVRIKALGYKEKALKNEIDSMLKIGDVIHEFRKRFNIGDRLTTTEIKTIMNEVYSTLGLNKKGVVSNLEKEYGIKVKAVKILQSDGNRKNGWEFI